MNDNAVSLGRVRRCDATRFRHAALHAAGGSRAALRARGPVGVSATAQRAVSAGIHVWTFDAGGIWAAAAAGGGLVTRAPTMDGSCDRREVRRGALGVHDRRHDRSRATISNGALYVQSGEDAVSARRVRRTLQWKVRVSEARRRLADKPKSPSILRLGGRRGPQSSISAPATAVILALDPATGARVWSFAAGDAVRCSRRHSTATPLRRQLRSERVRAGRRHAAALSWKHFRHRRRGRLSPAIHQGHVIVGSRKARPPHSTRHVRTPA